MEQHSEESNCVSDYNDTNPNSGSQSPKSSSNGDPVAIPSDQTAKLHEALETQLCLEEGESKVEQPLQVEEEVHEEALDQYVKKDEDKDSIGWNQVDDFNSGDSENNGGVKEEEDYNNKDDKFGDEFEKREEDGYRRHVYPVRPEAEDCSFYMKTGNCKFGSNCKFNHPVRRKNQYYLRTGGCKYGTACRYNHSNAGSPAFSPKTTIFPVSDLNFLGLPIRPGERECPFYMRNGSCKFGANCRFNHPDPTAVGGSDNNGGSASLQSSSQPNAASWSSPRGLNETPFMPIMYPPTQGLPSQSPEWKGYQAPVYPPERNIHPPPQYLRSPATDANAYPHQQKMSIDEFPERPGQPECTFYMKTGDCKFKFNCKYHHPKNHNSRSTPCILSDKGLPLRPGKNVCSYYSSYGICKYGPACKFDHPIQPSPSTWSVEDEDTPYAAEEEGTMYGTAIQQSL